MKNTVKTQEKYILPTQEFLIHDEPKEKYQILEQYYNDVYKLFLAKLSQFDSAVVFSEEDSEKLKSLLNELVYVKGLLRGEA